MLSFVNDYSEGAHEAILQRLFETNREQLTGYGEDIYCASAKEKIRAACDCPQAEVFFLVGGTQTNAVVIASMLKPYEGVLSAQSGHIGGHEAGAIEYTGHKVLPLPHTDGKLDADAITQYLCRFYADANHEHMVFPGMVYLSQPTEYGTLYSRAELEQISAVCREHQLPLYIDGARLGYALACPENDLTLPVLAQLCDVFYIGGTKVGALCGEAVVFTKRNAPAHFMTIVKQRGAMLAKGRLLGIQFDTLFTDNLYLKISENAIRTAGMLRTVFRENGYRLAPENPTNQVFIVLENKQLEVLQKQVRFGFWEAADETHTVVRFATSWATQDSDVQALSELLRRPLKP